MSTSGRDTLLRRAAHRAADAPFFLASALAVYQKEHGLDEAALAAWLKCGEEALPRLGLCRRPDSRAASFRADVLTVAAFAGVQPIRLATLLQEADAAQALRAAGSAGSLLAARDAEPGDQHEP